MADPINKRVQCFVLLSLLLAVASIILHARLFRAGASDGDLRPERSPRPTAEEATKVAPAIAKATAAATSEYSFYDRPCFRARNDTVPPSRRGRLRPPYVNLGFPKMGTSSLHSFFACAGYRAMHYRCNRAHAVGGDAGLFKCADCVRRSVEEGLAPFARCGKADAYSQLDDGSWGHFPQVEHLESIVRGVPNGTFLLTFRPVEKWYHSISHWPKDNEFGQHMSDGLRVANITGFPPGTGRNLEEFARWFCAHVGRVRDAVARDPSRTLVEVDLEDPAAGARLADAFDVDEGCWGRQNVNAKLHPDHDANRSRPDLPWFVPGKTCIRGKTRRRLRRPGPLPAVPGVPPWLLVVNETCDNDG